MTIAAFAVVIAFQVWSTFRGFDLTDEGFLMNLYQNFGSDISSCEGGAGYPLSCYLGWLCYSIWPGGGILWVRLCGVVIVTATMLVTYLMLRKTCPRHILLVALLCQAFVIASDPKPLGYNNLTALFAVVAVFLVLHGCNKGNYLSLALGGAIAALSFYLRLPNLAFGSLVLLAFVHEKPFAKQSWAQAAAFIAAYIAGLGAGWLIMKGIGADVLIINFFQSIGSTLDGESTHSAGNMLKTIASNYANAALLAAVVVASVIAMTLSLGKLPRWVRMVPPLALLWLTYFLFYTKAGILADKQNALLNGIGLAGCIILAIRKPQMRAIAAGAILLALCCPFGSDRGFVTVWTGTWLAFPLGLAALYEEGKERLQGHFEYAFWSIITVFCLTCFLHTEKRAYYDGGSKLEKRSRIESPYAKGITTSARKANIVNPLLQELQKRGLQEGDTTLVYSSSPMIYFLTNTKPYAGLAWPCLQFGDQYVHSFKKAGKNYGRPKFIVIQNYNNLGCGREWTRPSRYYMNTTRGWSMATGRMNEAVLDYIEKNAYTKTWTNRYYDLYE